MFGHLPYRGAMRESTYASGAAVSYLTDAIGVGTLTRLVPRELVDEVIASLDRTEIRKNKLPVRVVAYFVMAMARLTVIGRWLMCRKSCS